MSVELRAAFRQDFRPFRDISLKELAELLRRARDGLGAFRAIAWAGGGPFRLVLLRR